MKRTDFISLVKSNYPYVDGVFRIDVDVLDSQDNNEYLTGLVSQLERLGLPQKLIPAVLAICEQEYDSYYEEDEPDSEYCRYNVKINAHALYDIVALALNKNFECTDIYRLEDIQSGQGLYNNKISRNLITFESQPAPHEDDKLCDIFSKREQSTYRRGWSFGFKNLEQVKSWLQISDMNELEGSGLCLKKISVPELFVVEGNQQLIFRKEYAVSETTTHAYLVAKKVNKP